MRKRLIVGMGMVLFMAAFLCAETFTLYMGKVNNTHSLGMSFGSDIWDFLQVRFDMMKYLKPDGSLKSENPALDRSDLLGLSVVFTLHLPIHLIPYLDRFDYVQPFLFVGRGYAFESLASDYNEAPNAVDGATGFFNKVRSISQFGYGLIVMISPSFGLKADYRTIRMAEHAGMGLPGRKFSQLSVGVCFGPYKDPIRRIAK